MYVWNNIELVPITNVVMKNRYVLYVPSVFVALGTQHAMCVRHLVNYGLSHSTEFFTLSLNGTIFERKLLNTQKSVL